MSSNGWWFEKPREQHVEAAREEMHAGLRKHGDWLASAYTAPEIAYLMAAGYVDGWPLEMTRKGVAWYKGGGITPPIPNVFWKKVHDR